MPQLFRYYNPHPTGRNTDDCVKRAICLATGQDYTAVSTQLNRYKAITGAARFNTHRNPHRYVEEILGAKPQALPPGTTTADFCRAHPTGRYILDLPEHWTCCIDGTVYDTWDCTAVPARFAYRIDTFTPPKVLRYCCTLQPLSPEESAIRIYDGNGSFVTRTIPSHLAEGYIRCLEDSHYTYISF